LEAVSEHRGGFCFLNLFEFIVKIVPGMVYYAPIFMIFVGNNHLY